MKNADAAMYQAKEKGRNNYQFFKKEMNLYMSCNVGCLMRLGQYKSHGGVV
jgi:hypothetical protein